MKNKNLARNRRDHFFDSYSKKLYRENNVCFSRFKVPQKDHGHLLTKSFIKLMSHKVS
ncbi:MAG: hypothetical protein HQK62_04730 [Desulfamplus sp.]|nr:hypothetical protein [Desulfamplus sp.]